MAAMMRTASYRIHQSLVEKPLAIEDYWRLWSDGKKEKIDIVMTSEMFEMIKKAHGIN